MQNYSFNIFFFILKQFIIEFYIFIFYYNLIYLKFIFKFNTLNFYDLLKIGLDSCSQKDEK